MTLINLPLISVRYLTFSKSADQRYISEDINYNIDVRELENCGFTEYFTHTNGNGMIKDGMRPPENAKEIFMGGGLVDSDVLKMGIFATPDELFDQRDYPFGTETDAKPVRQYYTYYNTINKELGFSKQPTIKLAKVDPYDPLDDTKLSVTTSTDWGIFRCGSYDPNFNRTDFAEKHKTVFYYRL